MLAAAAERSALPHTRLLRRICSAIAEQRTLVLWVVWIAAGAFWGMLNEGWDLITAIYFAVSALATGGLQSPSLKPNGQLPNGSATFVAFYCLTGIPIFAMALGGFAHIFVQRALSAREKHVLGRPISTGEYEFAQQLFNADGQVDLSEFIALELLRLGKVDMGTLKLIKADFKRLDKDGSGKLSQEEVQRERSCTHGSNVDDQYDSEALHERRCDSDA
mmetsp:Transcript_61654/g.102563  ORF Transcript_61654/g.102563 Transcript_61654/m.102563 type:complete len:219 (+) Transcript_61654:407-1063(+)